MASTSAVSYLSGSSCVRRIKDDIRGILKEPVHGVKIESDEKNVMIVHVLISGPGGTPYEGGFFYFIVNFPNNYPWSPPAVTLMTTGGGTVRFNPNLYASGRVCLSILGTWPGPSWSPSMSLTAVLISIQSLMNDIPHKNEPSREQEKHPGDYDKYNSLIRHDVLKVAVLGMVNNSSGLTMPVSFQRHIQDSFLQNYNFYEQVAVANIHLSGKPIEDPLYFYSKGNYQYDHLLDRLESVKSELLLRTTTQW